LLKTDVTVTVLQADKGAQDQEYDSDIEKPQNACEFFVQLRVVT